MNLPGVFKLIHIFTAFWLVTGIIGRNVAMSRAARSKSLQDIRALLPIVDVFERGMVIPASTAALVAGLLTAWLQGWPILGFLQGGSSNWVLVSLLLFLTFIPIIVLIFLPRGKAFDAALKDAEAHNQITPRLAAAFNDPLVRAGHIYEYAALVVIVTLMVLKPF